MSNSTRYWYFDPDLAERGETKGVVYSLSIREHGKRRGAATEIEALDRLKVELRARYRQRMRNVRHLMTNAKEVRA